MKSEDLNYNDNKFLDVWVCNFIHNIRETINATLNLKPSKVRVEQNSYLVKFFNKDGTKLLKRSELIYTAPEFFYTEDECVEYYVNEMEKSLKDFILVAKDIEITFISRIYKTTNVNIKENIDNYKKEIA